jgi:hypothetical protein
MAELQNYRVTWEDGTVRYFQLDDEGLKAWKERAADKTSSIKSVEAGEPEPINPAAPTARRSA